MTVNLNRTPNHVRVNGDVGVDFHFGAMLGPVKPNHFNEPGHYPILVASFFAPTGSIRMELSPATATEFVRSITEALVSMPFDANDVHDAVLGVDE